MNKTIEVTDSLSDFSKNDLEMCKTFLQEAARNIDSEIRNRETERMFKSVLNKYIKFHWSENQYAVMFVRYAELSQIKEPGDSQKYIRFRGVGFRSHTESPYYDDNYIEFDTDFELKIPASSYYEAHKYRKEHQDLQPSDYDYWNNRLDEITEDEFNSEYHKMVESSTKTFEFFSKKIKEELNSK